MHSSVNVPSVTFVTSTAADFDRRWSALREAVESSGATVFVEGASTAPDARQLPFGRGAGGVLSVASALSLRARWEEDGRPDIVIATDLDALPAAAAAVKLVSGVALIATLDRSWEQVNDVRRGLAARLQRRARFASLSGAVLAAERWIALHSRARESWRALGVPGDRTVLLDSGWGVDAEFLQEARARDLVVRPGAPLRVGVIGGTDDVEALSRALAERGVDVQLAVVRSGGVALEAFDVVASFEEDVAHALTLQEAMALGRPIVAVREPAHESVVRHRETGVLFDRGDMNAAARGVEALVSVDVRERVGENARSLAARIFDRDLAVEKVLRLLDAVLSGETPEPARLSPGGRLVAGHELV